MSDFNIYLYLYIDLISQHWRNDRRGFVDIKQLKRDLKSLLWESQLSSLTSDQFSSIQLKFTAFSFKLEFKRFKNISKVSTLMLI